MKEIINAENKLYNWLNRNGVSGYDPFDLMGQVLLFGKTINSENKLIRLTFGRFFNVLQRIFPLTLRKVLMIKKTVNAKGVALIGHGHLLRFKNYGNQTDKERVYELIDWLWSNRCTKLPGASWGYPFDWNTRVFIPKGTPSIVVSYTVGEFLLQAYETFNDLTILDKASQITEFILKGLNRKDFDNGTCCFSYTPLDNFQVHNANLFAAAFLVRIGVLTDNKEVINWGVKSAKFAISEIKPDGSLNYWSNEQNYGNKTNDHYHVGFEIRSLAEVGQLTNDQTIKEAVLKYYKYYKNNYFHEPNGELAPKMYLESPFPIDIHVVSEAIILNSYMGAKSIDSDGLLLARKSALWGIKNMQNSNGSFALEHFRHRYLRWTTRIAYLRWGQAWMFYALNYYLLTRNS